MGIADRLKQLRNENGVSQRKMSSIIELDSTMYGKYERGERMPTIETLVKLADYFDVSADYLLGRTDVCHIAGTGSGVPDLPPEALRELESYKEYLRQKYGGK